MTDHVHPELHSAATLSHLRCARLHLRVGWWWLLFFLMLGVALEALHGFKVGWYADVDNETRRLMLRLAHAHGTLFAMINIVFAVTVYILPRWRRSTRSVASCCLLAATPLVPLGFLGGGLFIHEGDPGLPILLVPSGALLLFVAIALTACGIEVLAIGKDRPAETEETSRENAAG